MSPPNGAHVSPEQFEKIACAGCSSVIFDVLPRAFLMRDRLSPKSITAAPALGYKCSRCGKEPDLTPKSLRNT